MNSVMKKGNLFLRVAIGFAVGVLLGMFLPEFSIKTKVIGDIYLNAIRLMIIPIVSVAIFCGITNISSGDLLRKIGFRTVMLYVGMFVASSIVSLAIAQMIRPGLNMNLTSTPVYEGAITTPSVTSFLVNIVPTNIFKSFVDGSTLPVILFMIFLAVATLNIKEAGKPVIDIANSLSKALFKMLDYIMELSPLGVMSLMAFSIAVYGTGIFGALAKYIFTAWLACIAVFIVVMVIPTWLYTKVNLKKLLISCGKVALVSLSTTSSAATIPTTLQTSIEDLKAPKSISEFTIPLGSTINMCGGACSFCCLAIFVSDFYGLNLGLSNIVFLITIATLLNMAAPGIPGGGIVLGASFLSIIGLPFDLMGPISGFYRLLDMAFTTINVQGDLVANLVVSKSVNEWSAND